MSPRSFRPNLEALDGRVLLSGMPALRISDVSLAEGNSGQTAFVFTVTLSQPSKQRVSVDFTTADGTATAGPDYQAAAGTLTFGPGQTSKTITVLVNGDNDPERNEWFAVNLSGASHASLADATATGWIANDDAAPPGYYVDPYTGWLIPDQPYTPGDTCSPDSPYYPNC